MEYGIGTRTLIYFLWELQSKEGTPEKRKAYADCLLEGIRERATPEEATALAKAYYHDAL